MTALDCLDSFISDIKCRPVIYVTFIAIVVIFSFVINGTNDIVSKNQEFTAKCASLKGVAYIRNDVYKCYVNGSNTKID